MKTRFKHLLAACVPFWLVQGMVLFSGYIDGEVILRIFLPIFAISAVFLLMRQYWAGHGVWLAPTVGLLVEWFMSNGSGGRTNTLGILADLAISLLGYALCGVFQLVANARRKKKQENMNQA